MHMIGALFAGTRIPFLIFPCELRPLLIVLLPAFSLILHCIMPSLAVSTLSTQTYLFAAAPPPAAFYVLLEVSFPVALKLNLSLLQAEPNQSFVLLSLPEFLPFVCALFSPSLDALTS